MTEAEERAQRQMEHVIEDVHLDALRHPDPTGSGLQAPAAAVQTHMRTEVGSVQTYERLGRETSDPVVAVVMELLVEEEERHHALFQRIALSLEDRLNWATSAIDLLFGSAPSSHSANRTVETVRALELDERRGAQELRNLAHRERGTETGLPCLLLETMAMDSDKHRHLLALVAHRLTVRKPKT